MSNPLLLLGILIAVIFALSAKKMGFYHTWTMLFNLIIAIYLAIRIGPFIEDFFPAALSGQYSKSLALLATGTGVFLILQGIAYVLLIGQFEVTFPRIVNILGSSLLGFLAGFLVWSFAIFAFYTTPLCQNKSVKEIGFDAKTFEESKMQSYLAWWCNSMDTFIASGNDHVDAEKTLKELLTKPAKNAIVDANTKGTLIRPRPSDSNEPNRPITITPRQRVDDSHTEIPP
jgi:hypothetical protein